MYELYLQDKNLVDSTWWPVLENYHRTVADPTPTGTIPTVTDAAAPAAESPAVAAPEAAAAPAPAAPAAAPATGNIPVARTTSLQAKPQPIPADARTRRTRRRAGDRKHPGRAHDLTSGEAAADSRRRPGDVAHRHPGNRRRPRSRG